MRFAALLLLIALLAGCGGAGPTLPTREPFIAGVITKIENGRVLVEASPDKQEGNKCWFALSASTALAIEKDGKREKVDQGALLVGQKVKAWEQGPILESYPCQTGGEAILITQP